MKFILSPWQSILIFFFLTFVPLWLRAEGEIDQQDFTELARQSYEIGVSAGPLLPSRIPGVREIIPLTGIRASLPTSKGVFEIDGFTGRSRGVEYRSVALDYRLDVENDFFPIHFLLGFHGDYWKTPTRDWTYGGGWHYGGGTALHIAGPLYFRSDFKFRMSPGQSLIVVLGLALRFPSSASN